jgi:hypothetical protein|tara:strand:+ start:43 stop:870 length:828 start_codon:yes stop_codon:yes gene_type:complete
MPLTSKGEKLRDKFRGQYGKKKGDSIFYAMENSGKLKKVIKARGGMDASKADFKTPSTTAKAPPSQGFGNPPTQVTTSSQQNTTKKGLPEIGGVKVMGPSSLALGLAKQFIFDPLTKKSRTQKARGETLLGKPTKLPLTKDYYRLTGEPLDVMSPKGKNFLKEAGVIKPKKIVASASTNDKPQRCADGSLPPCAAPKTSTTNPSQSNFLKNFKAYNSGGVSSGPPPKRGPNPQVPPIKMRSGKMTNKYKMSCPHRPDGIRGMGAAIKGHKFIGVK